jgi:hypothetical protein
MTLNADDELRHPPGGAPRWRESLYWNFNDVRQGIGAWIYLWVLPGPPRQSGLIVSFYHGGWPDTEIYDRAMEQPQHFLREDDRWIYCFQHKTEQLVGCDFDAFELGGLGVKRIEPLRRQRLQFDDGRGSGFDLESTFLMPPYDYADGAHPTPTWMATNRYHRSQRMRGELRIAGKPYVIDCSGDSDHSWGTRDWAMMARHVLKMWSFQTDDGKLAASVINQGTDEGVLALGYLNLDGKVRSARKIESRDRFDANGVQTQTEVTILDECGGVVRATCPSLHSYIGWRVGANGEFWGHEGVGTFEIDGWGRIPGATSFFWPHRITSRDLATGSPTLE